MRLLADINSPADVRALSLPQLKLLASELRECIINTVADTGGHLATNLGAVELTLALHYALDTPQDKIVFDVGHQCYAHKLITGRREQFSTLRQRDGLSGFCNSEESEYDLNISGHASNSISLALGLALARDLNKEKHRVVAVIGDGALTGGMAFEALNQAGETGTPLIVLLNDNAMSISGNVGALSRRLSRLRSASVYNLTKQRTRALVERLPLIGRGLYRMISGSKNLLKKLLVPGGMFFEDLGFVYLGPIDGHDIKTVVSLLQQAAELNKPVLLHLRTVKGKGYIPAQTAPERWHGAEPFNINDGSRKLPRQRSFTTAFGENLCRLAAQDERVCAITAAMTDGTGLSAFAAQYPSRFFDVGIAEQHAAALAAGLARAGKRPVLAIYSTFLQRAYDQLLEDICLQHLPVLIAVDRAGVVGADGYSHQGQFDISYLRSVPGLTVLAPADEQELRLMLDWAMTLDAPCALRWPRATLPASDEHSHPPLQMGRGVLLRPGRDLTLVALGAMVAPALEAAQQLAELGVSCGVADARFAAPLDVELLHSCLSIGGKRLITLEDNIASGGFGEACRAALAGCDCQISSLSLPDSFLPHGKRSEMLHQCGLDAAGIIKAARPWFSRLR